MSANRHTDCITAASPDVGAAVGVDSRKWFVAVVNHNSEKSVEEKLNKLNYETYVAKQTVLRIWKNGRKAMVDNVVIPSLVFVKCTEKERREIVTLPFINRFLTNKAATSASGRTKPLATIPQQQIDTLRFMLGQSDIPVSFVETPFRRYDKVVIIRGNLKGIEGEIIEVNEGKGDVIIRIELLGSAKMTIDTVNLELIK